MSRVGALPVPRLAGKTIHSAVDPRGEALRFVDAFRQRSGVGEGDRVAVLGNGFGYVAEGLLERGISPVAFEPSISLFQSMARHRDMGAFLKSVPLYLFDHPADLYRNGGHRSDVAGVKAVLALPYVEWLFPGTPADFERKLSAIRRSENAYHRVSVVSPLLGGSWEIARYAARGLQAAGHLVDFVDMSPFGGAVPAIEGFHGPGMKETVEESRRGFLEWNSKQILARVNAFDPGVVLVLAQAPLSSGHIREMRESGRRVVCWFVEDSHLFRAWEEESMHYDLFFPIQKGDFLRHLEEVGQPRRHYLPLAADPAIFFPASPSGDDASRFGARMSFMGAGYYNRRRFFNALLGKDFKIWGTQWPAREPLTRHVQEGGRRVNSEETATIFNATGININLHSSTSHEGVNPFGDFVNPRTFEIAACSAFQLVDERALLPELFVPGEEVVCFSGRDDFLGKLDHYLADETGRAVIARRGMDRVLREHTYRDRMREMMEAVCELCPPEEDRRLETAREMSAQLSDPAWERLLADFPQDRPVPFDALVRSIAEKPQGTRVTREEALVLLMGGLRYGAA